MVSQTTTEEVEELSSESTTETVEEAQKESTGFFAKVKAFIPSILLLNDPVDIGSQGIIKNVSGSGTAFDPDSGQYLTGIEFDFQFLTSYVQANGNDYYFDLGDHISIADTLLNQSYPLKDGEGSTYNFKKNPDGTYRVEIHLTQAYVDGAGEHMEGDVKFNAKIDASEVGNDNGIHTPFTDTLQLNIPSDQIKYPDGTSKDYDIDTWKDNPVYDPATNTLTYSVVVRSKRGTPSNITFEDQLSGSIMNQVNGNPVIKVEKGIDESQYYQHDWQTISVSSSYNNGKINMTLPKINAKGSDNLNDCYRITYTYQLKDGEYTAAASNKVNVSSTGNGQIVTDHDQKDSNIERKVTLTKTGVWDETSKRIKWTVTVNEKNMNIAGSAVFDALFADGQDFTVSPNRGYQWTTTNGKRDGIKFNAVDNGKNTNKYTITYYTTVEDNSFDGTSVHNTATYDGDGNKGTTGDQTGVGTYVTTPGGSVEKELAGSQTNANGQTDLTWNVTIDIPKGGLPAGTVLYDEIRTDNQDNNTHYMTVSQIMNWGAKVKWSGDNREYGPGSDLIDYSGVIFKDCDTGTEYNFAEVYQNSQSLANHRFKLQSITLKRELNNNSATKLTYTYHTTADTSANPGNHTFSNTAIVNNKRGYADYTGRTGGVEKLDGNNKSEDSTTRNTDGTLTWKVRVYPDKAKTTYTVIDTLPEYVVLDQLVFGNGNQTYDIPENGNISYSNWAVKYEGSYNKNTGVVTFTMTPDNDNDFFSGNANYHEITFNCHIDTSKIPEYQKGQTYTFGNKVVVNNNDGTELGHDSQTQTWKDSDEDVHTGELDKTGKWDKNAQVVHYKVFINNEGKDLLEGADRINFEDSMTYNFDKNTFGRYYFLDQSSVRLYYQNDGEVGAAVPDSYWNYSSVETIHPWNDGNGDPVASYEDGSSATNVIKASIPDNVPLVLEYDYVITMQQPIIAEWGNYHGQIAIKNTAKLYGDTEYEDDDNRSDQWDESETSGKITTDRSLILYKTEEGNFNKRLQGAVFTIYHTSNNGSLGSVLTTKTTDDKGRIIVQFEEGSFDYNTLYAIKETQAPPGYQMPDNPQTFYFYVGSPSHQNKLPENLPTGTMDIGARIHSITVTNAKLPSVDVTVNKKWFAANGDATDPIENEIKFDLYKVPAATAAGYQIPDTGVLTDAIINQIQNYRVENNVTLNNDNNWIWTKTYDTQGEAFKFYVVETSTGSYTTTYKDQGTSVIDINNKELPEIEVEVTKEWFANDGNPLPDSEKKEISFDLYMAEKEKADTLTPPADGVYTAEMMNQIQAEVKVSGQKLNANNQWKWSTKYQTDGKEYVFFVIENSVEHFKTTYEGQGTAELKIKNTKKGTDTVNVTKRWFRKLDGNTTEISHPGTIQFNIYRVAIKGEGPDVDPDPGPDVDPVPDPHTHNYSSQVTKEATCHETGIRTYSCTCGDTYTETIPINHSDGTYLVNDRDATATEDGYTGDVYCSGCNVKLQEGTVIPKTGGGGSQVTVDVKMNSEYANSIISRSITSGVPATITVTYVGAGQYEQPDLSASIFNGSALTVNKSAMYTNTSNVECIDYSITFTPTADTIIICGLGGNSDKLKNWSISQASRSRMMARSVSAPAAFAATPQPGGSGAGIPETAVKLNQEPLTLYASNNWSWSGTYDADEGYTYEYYVEEVYSGEWEVTYENQGTHDLVINNTITDHSYELPHTGGMGTTPFTISGLALLAAAGGIMINKKRRKEDD
ncbi:MAG: prealbumin-like fold domain-containing protein [Eubacteriales bacterium]|nr:prealbumin-like fold domain-containing protein [Eubacteriales bacterium]